MTLGALGVLGACGGGSASPAATPREPVPVAAGEPACPVTVPGTSVSVEDSATGAALVFVTTSDVVELRERVAAMARMHNEHHGAMGPLPDGTGGGGGHDHAGHAGHDMGGGGHEGHGTAGGAAGGEHGGSAGGMIGVHSKATAMDVEGGAKLEITVDSADVARLQGELRMHAQHLARGTCELGHH